MTSASSWVSSQVMTSAIVRPAVRRRRASERAASPRRSTRSRASARPRLLGRRALGEPGGGPARAGPVVAAASGVQLDARRARCSRRDRRAGRARASRRASIVSRSRSVLTLVASTGPCHSRIAGIASPVVLPVCVGATTSVDCSGSQQTRRRPRRPSVTRPAAGRDASRRAEIGGRSPTARLRGPRSAPTPAMRDAASATQRPPRPRRRRGRVHRRRRRAAARARPAGHARRGSPRWCGSSRSAPSASASPSVRPAAGEHERRRATPASQTATPPTSRDSAQATPSSELERMQLRASRGSFMRRRGPRSSMRPSVSTSGRLDARRAGAGRGSRACRPSTARRRRRARAAGRPRPTSARAARACSATLSGAWR